MRHIASHSPVSGLLVFCCIGVVAAVVLLSMALSSAPAIRPGSASNWPCHRGAGRSCSTARCARRRRCGQMPGSRWTIKAAARSLLTETTQSRCAWTSWNWMLIFVVLAVVLGLIAIWLFVARSGPVMVKLASLGGSPGRLPERRGAALNIGRTSPATPIPVKRSRTCASCRWASHGQMAANRPPIG